MFVALALAYAATAQAPAIEGTWHNPKNTVAVRTGACGGAVCGVVVRASAEAEAASRQGTGGARLIGATLLRDYRHSGRNTWSGTLFVPDMGRTVGSTITLVDTNTIDVKGCLVGRFFCKTQTWRRD